MLNTAKEIIEVCESKNFHLYDLVLEGETKALKMTEEEMKKKLQEILDVMKASSHETLDKTYDTE
ncbi:MAG: L-serine ammonia-lyase, iron-sulfur-dependent, subunit alpha, partial [Peptoniphilus harei]|nr:L-serine ammonia-lyase, iron-sulfur-dependent, subunit alpha [Peptoniphilus harei]